MQFEASRADLAEQRGRLANVAGFDVDPPMQVHFKTPVNAIGRGPEGHGRVLHGHLEGKQDHLVMLVPACVQPERGAADRWRRRDHGAGAPQGEGRWCADWHGLSASGVPGDGAGDGDDREI